MLYYMSTSINDALVYIIWFGRYSGIHRNVSGIVLLKCLLYYLFALNL